MSLAPQKRNMVYGIPIHKIQWTIHVHINLRFRGVPYFWTHIRTMCTHISAMGVYGDVISATKMEVTPIND